MAQRNVPRIDRFAQMSKQEEIIAKKRQEILERQRTAQLAKAVVAAQTLAAKMKADSDSVANSDDKSESNVDTKTDDAPSCASAETLDTPKEAQTPSTEKSDALLKGKKDESTETSSVKSLNSFTGKTGKISFGLKRVQPQVPVTEQPAPKVVNSFCNDGSFLENFKKILEKHEPKPPKIITSPETSADGTPTDQTATAVAAQAGEADAKDTNIHVDTDANTAGNPISTEQATMVPLQHQAPPQPGMPPQMPQLSMQHQHNQNQHHHQYQQQNQQQHPHQHQQQLQHQHQQQPVPPPPPPHQHMHAMQSSLQPQLQSLPSLQPQQQPPSLQHQAPQANILQPTQPQYIYNHPHQPPPVPPPHHMTAAFFAAAPPPPPPPQMPMTLTLGPLYMIPAPEPLQLNAIPAPKEFNLNAIPKPQMNVEAIQMPHSIQQPSQQTLQAQHSQQQQQLQQQQQQQLQQHQQQQQQQQQLQQEQQKPQQLQQQHKQPQQQAQQQQVQPQVTPQVQQLQPLQPLTGRITPPPPPPQLPPLMQQLKSQVPPQLHHTQPFPLKQQQQQVLHQSATPPPPPQQQQLPVENQSSSAQKSDNNDHSCSRVQLPTTVEHLIDLVAENGDDYEDKIRAYKNDLHPAMWFLFEKNCEQYHNYRKLLNEHNCKAQYEQQQLQQQTSQKPATPPHQSKRQQQQQQQQQPFLRSENYDSLEMDEDSSDSGGPKDYQQEKRYLYHQQQRQQQQEQMRRDQPSPLSTSQNDNADKYDPESVISGDIDSDDEYMRGMLNRNRTNLKRRIECRNELSEEERQEREAEAELEEQRRQERKKQRKSRWGEKVQPSTSAAGSLPNAHSNVPTSFGNQNKPMLSAVTRSDPALLQYARLNYGSTNLSEEDWKKCEEHYKVNLLYQDMMKKRQEIDRLARNGKFKYEYDSDEDVEGGTWEHKLRCAEMEATKLWATALTKQSEGKHHIGDFLPPEELKKFMEKYDAKKNNRQPDLSDYKEYKLKEDNIGFQMLQKLGWKEGQGLGQDGAGIVDPVNKAPQRDGNQGLGVASADTPEDNDNEYDAYRKRMMLAYRFRPNPLNNPRRAYY